MKKKRIMNLLVLMMMFVMISSVNISGEAASLIRPVISKINVVDYNALNLSWKSVPGADGYVIYRKTGSRTAKKIAMVTGMENCSYTNTKLTTGTVYTYSIKAFKRNNTKTVYSSASKGKSGKPLPLSPVIDSTETKGSKQITLSWSKVNGASGYTVYRAVSSGGTYKAIKTISGNANCTYTDKTAENYKNYYYKVKAYRTVNSKKYYGTASAYCKFKIDVPVTQFSMPSEKHLALGKKATLVTTILPANATDTTVVWKSSDPKTVSVDNGVIKALKLGKAVITAKASNGTICSCTVTSGLKEVRNLDEFVYESLDLSQRYNTGISTIHSGRLIVKSKVSNLNLSGLANLLEVVKGFENYYVLQFGKSDSAWTAYDVLKNNSNVEYVTMDDQIPLDRANRLSANYLSWGVPVLGTDILAKQVADTTSDSITVAVIDSGVDMQNPFLAERLAPGYDMVMNNNLPQDKYSHGTHVSGIIVDNTPGIPVMLMPIRVMNGEGEGSALSCGLAFLYAADKGAKVINFSIGGSEDEFLEDTIHRAVQKGVTVVVSAGNDYTNIATALHGDPARLGVEDGIICVAALTEELTRDYYSNYGEAVDVSAPGSEILSYVVGGEIQKLTGTSMAAPHISAIAAMEKLLHPSATPAQIENLIKETCYDLFTSGRDDATGYGIPNYTGNEEKQIYSLRFLTSYGQTDAMQSIMEGVEEELYGVRYSPSGVQAPDLTYTSSDPSIVTVQKRYNANSKEMAAYIKGVAPGKAVITARTSYGVEASIVIYVRPSVKTTSLKAATGVEGIALEPQIAYRSGEVFYRVPCIGGPSVDVKDAKQYYLRFQNLDPYVADTLFLDVRYHLEGGTIQTERFLLQKEQFVLDGSASYYPLEELIRKVPEGKEFQICIALWTFKADGSGEMSCAYKGSEEPEQSFWFVKK